MISSKNDSAKRTPWWDVLQVMSYMMMSGYKRVLGIGVRIGKRCLKGKKYWYWNKFMLSLNILRLEIRKWFLSLSAVRKRKVVVLFYFKISMCHWQKEEFPAGNIRNVYTPVMAWNNNKQRKDTANFFRVQKTLFLAQLSKNNNFFKKKISSFLLSI